MNKIDLIESLIRDTQEVKAEAERLAALSQKELKQKPSPQEWSVLECIEHLNIADAHYISQFDRKLQIAPESEESTFKPGWMGDYFVKSIKPRADGTIPSPMKTLKKFQPEIDVHYDTLSKFIEDQDEIIAALEKSKKLDLNKIKITSAIGSIVTFKLGDAFRFLIGHNQRHMIQAKRALEQVVATV
ncbi:DinB family protein [Reichenbachiella carrageenanivorans]|uniref:DinB family protein n=1 Tax=Reichenbachiella carrageenanivorans TaxID=2979869 RepID=A0ABY6D0B2_9BACT|nr:DinB family protein [Reichenbachiella carrageenanivorans]UXX79601.1 DinB family protein [Reichenbachiella carrageenanivorans]